MSWGQYLLLQRGYWQKQNRIWEEEWRRTREIYWILYNCNVKKEDQLSRNELIPLPSDPKPKGMALQQEDTSFFAALAIFETKD